MAQSTQPEVTLGASRLIVPQIAIPMIAGAVSWLAVLNAAPNKEGLVDTVLAYGAWYLIGCVAVVLLGKITTEDLIKWSPIVGGIGIVLLLVPLLFGPSQFHGIHGAIGILPAKGVYAVLWHLATPAYIAWLVRFSPARMAPDRISWKAFGVYCIAAAVWWIPLMLTPTVAGSALFVALFLLLCWLDRISLDKIATAAVLGAVVVAGTSYRLSMVADLKSDRGLLRTAFGTGGLFGRKAGDAFHITYFLPETDSYTVFLSAVESIGIVGVLAVLACLMIAIIWGLQRSVIGAGNQRLLAEVFVAALLVTAVMFLWAAAGILPKVDFSMPLFSGSGCGLIATMVMLRIILSGTSDRRPG